MQDGTSQDLIEHTLKLFSLIFSFSEIEGNSSLLRRFVQLVLDQGKVPFHQAAEQACTVA
jgi:hypothetical protein